MTAWRIVVTAALVLLCGSARAETERLSVDNNGLQGNGTSQLPDISRDGRFVTFISLADNLVPGDTNNLYDVFVHDRQNRTTQRVSVSSAGVEGNGTSGILDGTSYCPRPEISADGRWVVFQSHASNLVAGDTNKTVDVFVHDRQTGQTTRESLDAGGGQIIGSSRSPAISASGRYVAFVSASPVVVPGDTNDFQDVFIRDRVAGTTERISLSSGGAQGNGESSCPSLSADGRFVAFYSGASNLVPGDSNDNLDVFVRDRLNQTTVRVSVASDGTQGNAISEYPRISGDGLSVAFRSVADNLVPGDTNGLDDVFVHRLQSATTLRASTAVNGNQAVGGPSSLRDIDDAGRHVTFRSGATNLVPGDSNGDADLFVKDLQTGMIRRANLAQGGAQSTGAGPTDAAISGNGRVLAYSTTAADIVAGDSNRVEDVFASTLPSYPFEYAAKVICGTSRDEADQRLAPGLYATTVNIHAPRGGTELFKKLALAIPPDDQTPGRIYPIAQHVLQYDEALAVGCLNLQKEVFGGDWPASFIDGFLVVQSTAPLDVTAVYTTAAVGAAGTAGAHSSIDVQTVLERRRSAVLSVQKSGRYFCDSEPVARECTLVAALYTVELRNDGAVPAVAVVVEDQVSRSDGLGVVALLAAPVELPPGAVFALTGPASARIELAELGPGEQVQFRFWALAVISPASSPDQVINRVTATAQNAEVPVAAAISQSFD